jgi:predicted deacylase
MNKLYLIICVLTILLIIYHINLNKICSSEPTIFKYGKDNDNNLTILIVGGTHGNEPAGTYIINKIMDKLNKYELILKYGKLILIPAVNNCGLKLNTRSNYLYNDINRSYNTNNKINKKVLEYAKDADIIIDIHEAWGFHQLNNESLGSTISMTKWDDSEIIKNRILNDVNDSIMDDAKKFVSVDIEKNDYFGTLSQYARNNNKKFMLIEITGQNDIQPLDTRINHGYLLIESMLKHYNLI